MITLFQWCLFYCAVTWLTGSNNPIRERTWQVLKYLIDQSWRSGRKQVTLMPLFVV